MHPRGEDAEIALSQEGLNVTYHQLDIEDLESVEWYDFVILWYLLYTEVPEIQDVHWPKSMATPPTAQTAGPNWLKFFMEALQEDSFRGNEAIFEFHPRSRDKWPTKSSLRVFPETPKALK